MRFNTIKWRNGLCIIISMAILFDFYPFKAAGISVPPQESSVYRYIKEHSGPEDVVLNIPLWPGDTAWSSLYQYMVTLSGISMINGYTPGVPVFYYNDIFLPLSDLNLGEIREKQYHLLKKLNVRYIVLHEEGYPPKVSPYPFQFALEKFLTSPYVEFVDNEDPFWLFRLKDEVAEREKSIHNYSNIGMFYEAERLPRLTGRIIRDSQSSGDYLVSVQEGEDAPGFMTFGPYSYNPTGTYRVVFRIKTDSVGVKEPVAMIEITTDKGNTLIKEKYVRGSDFNERNIFQDVQMQFSVLKPTEIEYRVNFLGKGNVKIDYIYVVPESATDPLTEIIAGELFRAGRVVRNEEGGDVVHFIAGVDPEDISLYGPYRRYLQGDYTIIWNVKFAKEGEAGPAGIFEIVSDCGTTVLAKKEISFPEKEADSDSYRQVEQKIELEKPTVLDFRFIFTGKRDVWVDKIRIRKDNNTI